MASVMRRDDLLGFELFELPDAILAVDRQGVIRYANRQAGRLFGSSRQLLSRCQSKNWCRRASDNVTSLIAPDTLRSRARGPWAPASTLLPGARMAPRFLSTSC